MGAVGVEGGYVHARQQQGPTDGDGQAERDQQGAGEEQLVIEREAEQERSRSGVDDADDDAGVVPRSEPLDDEDLSERAHCDARHQDPEAVGGVAVQGLGDGRHHLHEWERDQLGERRRQERPTQDGELPEEPSCVAEARSMDRSLIVRADGEDRDDSQQRQVAERRNQEHRRDADRREEDAAECGTGDAGHAHGRGGKRRLPASCERSPTIGVSDHEGGAGAEP
jgi:hypothetical protein